MTIIYLIPIIINDIFNYLMIFFFLIVALLVLHSLEFYERIQGSESAPHVHVENSSTLKWHTFLSVCVCVFGGSLRWQYVRS